MSKDDDIYEAGFKAGEKSINDEWYDWAMILKHHIEQIGTGDDGVNVHEWLENKTDELRKEIE